MHLPDPLIVYMVVAAIAANRLPGRPVWLLGIGPPSSGKTEVLAALSKLPEFHSVSTITMPGLLSVARTKGGGWRQGGLLVEIGESGVIVASDFGTLLTQNAAGRAEVFALLREVYDGHVSRHLGSGGGVRCEWEGDVGFVGACTQAIDSSTIDLGQLGERFTYYRIPKTSSADKTLSCQVAGDYAGHHLEVQAERAQVVAEFFEGLTIPDELPTMSEAEEERLIGLADIGALCRSSVVRDGYSREVDNAPDPEEPTRFYLELRQMHAGLVLIGTQPTDMWRGLVKVALDGIHPVRRKVIDYLMAHPGEHSTSSIVGHCQLTETPTRRHLEDLMQLGALERVGDHPARWTCSDWLRESWWAVDGEWGPDR
jgi:hypothetical protein